MVVRLGILSTARISNVIVMASKQVEDLEVVAVASRTPPKAETFAKAHGIGRICTYDELLSSSDIDAVYVPLPTELAPKWAELAAKSGKHILVDKPFASAEAVQSISDAAQSAQVIFLDGTHFVHSARTKQGLEYLQNSCGEPRIVKVSFSAPLDLCGDIRTDTSLEPYGALGDLGWYCARSAVHFLGTERTEVLKRVACFGNIAKEGWVQEASGMVEFSGGEKLCMDCSFSTVLRQRVEVAGTRGTVRVNDFVMPEDQWDNPGVAKDERVETELVTETGVWAKDSWLSSPSKIHTTTIEEGKNGIQTVRMLKEFVRMITNKDTTSSAKWAKESVNTQMIIDALYKDCVSREENK